MSDLLATLDEERLREWVIEQRWFGSKTREIAHLNVLEAVTLRDETPRLVLALVEARFPSGTHEVYQVPIGVRPADEELVRARDRRGRRAGPSTTRSADPAHARELLHRMRLERRRAGERRDARLPLVGRRGRGRDGRGAPGRRRAVQLLDRLRRDADPEGVPARRAGRQPGARAAALPVGARTSRTSRRSPAGTSTRAGSWTPRSACCRSTSPARPDGWELALDALSADPEAFLADLHALGVVTGELHTALGSEASDPAFAPEEPSAEALSLLTATIDEEIERIFVELPDDPRRSSRSPAAARTCRSACRRSPTSARAGASSAPTATTTSARPCSPSAAGCSSTSRASPARPLSQRRRKRSPLRDVAGMLRSFGYAAAGSRILRDRPAPEGWEDRARATFLEGYFEAVDSQLLPPGEDATRKLLADLRAREGGLRAALRAQQPARLGRHPGGRHRPPARIERRNMSADPHAFRGAHPADGGVVIRTVRPAAREVTVYVKGKAVATLEPADNDGLFEGVVPKAELPLAYELEVDYGDGATFRVQDPYRFAPTLGDMDLYLAGEGRHEEIYARLGAHVIEHEGVQGTSFAVWAPAAQAVSVVGDLNYWDPPPAPDALARLERDLGAVHPRGRRRHDLQVRDHRARRHQVRQGRPVRVRGRGAAQDRLGRARARARLARRGVAGEAPPEHAARGADVGLRGPPRLVAAEPARGQPLAHLPRARRRAGRLREGHGLHPPRAAAGDAPPLQRLVGLPGDRLLRAVAALRVARRLPRVRRPPSRPRPRRDPRLGPRALPEGRVRARALRRHRALRARRPAPRRAPRLGHARLQLRAPRGAQLPRRQRPVLDARVPRRRHPGRRRRLDALPRLLARARASGCRTSSAAARTSTRSPS